jgi:hypothetical protein
LVERAGTVDERRDEAKRAEVCMWVERGLSLRYASAMARVRPELSRKWVMTEEFEGQFLQSRARRMLRLQGQMAGAVQGDWQRYATFLERQFSDEWCVRKVVDTSIEVNYTKTVDASETLAYLLACVREEADAVTFDRVLGRLARGSADRDGMRMLLQMSAAKAQGEELEVEYHVEEEKVEEPPLALPQGPVKVRGVPRKLPPNEELLRLREELSMAEIGRRYGCSEAGVRASLKRAAKRAGELA